jgi:hypothetical protein
LLLSGLAALLVLAQRSVAWPLWPAR